MITLSENRVYIIVMWVLTIFFSVIPGGVMYLLKGNDPFIRNHAIQAIHFAIVIFLTGIICWVLKIILIGGILLYFLSLINIGVCLYSAFRAFNGLSVSIIPRKFLLLK